MEERRALLATHTPDFIDHVMELAMNQLQPEGAPDAVHTEWIQQGDDVRIETIPAGWGMLVDPFEFLELITDRVNNLAAQIGDTIPVYGEWLADIRRTLLWATEADLMEEVAGRSRYVRQYPGHAEPRAAAQNSAAVFNPRILAVQALNNVMLGLMTFLRYGNDVPDAANTMSFDELLNGTGDDDLAL